MSKSLIATALVFSFIGGHIAFAQTGTTTTQTAAPQKRAARAGFDGACVGAAVGVRDDAIIAAHNLRNTALTTALNTRKIEVQAAWNITDQKARRTAREAAWKKSRTAGEVARRQFRVSADTAYLAFNNAVKACGVQGYTESASQDAAAQ